MVRKWIAVWFPAILAIATSVACSNEAKPSPKQTDAQHTEINQTNDNEAYTFHYLYPAGVPPVDAQNQVKEEVRKKFPNVTVEFLEGNVPNLLASGVPIDALVTNDHNLPKFMDLGLSYNMDPLIKKYNLNVEQLSSDQLKIVRGFSDKGELYGLPGLPDKYVPFALVYNKDLFDKFAIPYPKTYLTWDQTIQLAKRLTRSSDGIDYKGLMIFHYAQSLLQQSGFNLVDNSGISKVLGDPRILQSLKTIKNAYAANGNWLNDGNLDSFAKAGNVAMIATGGLNGLFWNPDLYPNLNWDMTYYPAEGPDPTIQGIFAITMLTSTSKNKDLAFQIISYLMQDKDMQTLVDERWAKLEASGKNIEAIKGNHIHLSYYISNKYTADEIKVWGTEVSSMLKLGTDTNTVLRDLDDQVKTMVNNTKAKGGD